jgi:hypothetical protein
MKTKTTAENSAYNSLETNTSEQFKTWFNIKFYVMKKQILFLLVALFAVTAAFAQSGTPSDAPTCVATALTPAAGEKYNYAATISGPGFDGAGNFTWYVTQDVNLLTGAVVANDGTEIIASGAGMYNAPIAGANNIDIIWTSAALATAKPYYLVVKYEQANSTATPTCTAQNLKVYRIVPMNTFWLRIENVADATGATGGDSQCAPDVIGAVVTEGATPTVEYTYGQSVLYVKISATGYVGDWTPTLRIAGLVNDQAISAAGITWTSGAATGTFTGSGSNGDYTSNNPMPSTMAVAPATTGTEIIVTIPIDNLHHEALADQTITVAIDGSYTSGATTFNDLSNVNGDCTAETAFADATDQTIKARPTVSPVAPSTFVPEPTTLP